MTGHTSHDVVAFDNRDIARYTPGERRMAMRGFEDDYPDIVDYIIRITHRIWEEKEVGYIYDTYQHNCIIHGSGDDRHGREGVVQATLQSLASFSECRIYGDDVIWTGNEDDGFHTSHLITEVNINTGWTSYGPPTGRKAVSRCIANCLSKSNKIFEEWLLYDEPYIIRQMGYDVNVVVEQEVRTWGAAPVPVGDTERMLGQYAPQPLPTRTTGGFDVEDFIRTTYHEVWNRRRLNTVAKYYAPSHRYSTTGNRRFHGPGELTNFILNMLAMFPDASVSVDHVYWNGDDERGYRVAVRWSLVGTHTGYGEYGPPSGARVRAMAISHHRIKRGVFIEEYSLFDEMSILRQIAARRMYA